MVQAGPAPTKVVEPPIRPADRDHWAFRAVQRPPLPVVKNAGWIRNPVDAFILCKLEAAGLEPMPEADRATLLRRLTFDLTGLPPTPAELEAFQSDPAPDAYERQVDRLLASPAYGERWAQHWLDLARFAETDGFEFDQVRPNAWRYRDWVIAAFNQDLGYDVFVQRQVAGDLLSPDNPAARIATGFLLCGPDMPDLNLQAERRHNVLNEMTATVGAVFLGLQVGCAQCHDHKFDPISQADFYRLRAFFDSVELFKELPIPTPAQLAERRRAEAQRGGNGQQAEAALQALETAARRRLREKNPDLQPTRADLLGNLTTAERQQYAALSRQLAPQRKLPDFPLGRVLRAGPAQPSTLFVRGDFRRPGPVIEPAFPRIANVAGATTAGANPRIALARWLTRPDNPLTTLVIVNRLWQHHFGRGLVPTASDFGTMGEPPSHPELLDWLATELPRQGWRLKRLHRLLLTSAVYRLASRPISTGAEKDRAAAALANGKKLWAEDPENRLLGRMRRQRLDGEAIRDAMLAAANRLQQRSGGPGIRPPLPAELVHVLLKDQWPVTPDRADHDRRSIYLFVRRNLRYPLFEVFDRPDTNASCPQRSRSTIAPQALFLLNSDFSLAAARSLAQLATTQVGADVNERIRVCYQRTLGRPPAPAERALAQEFLASRPQPPAGTAQPSRHDGASDLAALTDLCLALFNLNEFVYVD